MESVLEPSPLSGNVTLGSITESALDASGCSCVPTDAAMPGLADFVRYLGDYINTPNGRFSSYIVWNEVVSWCPCKEAVDGLLLAHALWGGTGVAGAVLLHAVTGKAWEQLLAAGIIPLFAAVVKPSAFCPGSVVAVLHALQAASSLLLITL